MRFEIVTAVSIKFRDLLDVTLTLILLTWRIR